MVAIRVILVMMVSVPVGVVIIPVVVVVPTVCAVIVSVSAIVSLVAKAIFVVVAFMVATLIHNCWRSDLDSEGNLCVSFRRRRQADENEQTEYCEYQFL